MRLLLLFRQLGDFENHRHARLGAAHIDVNDTGTVGTDELFYVRANGDLNRDFLPHYAFASFRVAIASTSSRMRFKLFPML